MKKHNITNKAKSLGDTVGTALVGAALDVAAGIALAPEMGKKFYNDVKKKSAEFHTKLETQSKKVKAGVKAKVKAV